MPFLDTLKALPPRSKGILAVSAVAIIGIAFLLLRIAGAPSYTLLSSGLDPAQTGKVTAALDEGGIAYELRNNGTGLAVAKGQVAQARVAVAGAGVSLDGASGQGFELFDEQKLGASDFQQKVTYQRALEGEIARTIGGVEGVTSPQVQLVLPEDDLFADEASPATAAVMLGNSSDTMEGGATAGIAQLVASSVKGLKTDNVTITDSSGSLLWPAGDGSGAGGVAAGKQALEARYSRAMEADLNAMLVRTLGPGKAQVEVSADLNADKTSSDEVVYEKKGTPLKKSTETEKLKGGGTTTGGTAGTGSQHPHLLRGRRRQRRRTRTTSARPRAPTSASARRSCAPRSPPARSRSSTLRCSWTSPSRPPTSPPSSRRSPVPRASTPSAVTRCRPRRSRSPRSRRRRPARCRPPCSARSSGSASASRRCCSCSS